MIAGVPAFLVFRGKGPSDGGRATASLRPHGAALNAPIPERARPACSLVGAVLAAIPGRVTAGQTLVTPGTMRIEQALAAPFDARAAELNAAGRDRVDESRLLVRVGRSGT